MIMRQCAIRIRELNLADQKMTTYYTIIIVLNDDARIYMVCYTMTMWSMLTISTGQLGPVRNEIWDRQYGGSSSLAIIEAVTPLKLVRTF